MALNLCVHVVHLTPMSQNHLWVSWEYCHLYSKTSLFLLSHVSSPENGVLRSQATWQEAEPRIIVEGGKKGSPDRCVKRNRCCQGEVKVEEQGLLGICSSRAKLARRPHRGDMVRSRQLIPSPLGLTPHQKLPVLAIQPLGNVCWLAAPGEKKQQQKNPARTEAQASGSVFKEYMNKKRWEDIIQYDRKISF